MVNAWLVSSASRAGGALHGSGIAVGRRSQPQASYDCVAGPLVGSQRVVISGCSTSTRIGCIPEIRAANKTRVPRRSRNASRADFRRC